MSSAAARNRHFDDLFATADLRWLGQNTNHVPAHPDVLRAMVRSIESEEFHAYAPPLGFEALRRAIVDDLGVAATGAEALVTEGGVSALSLLVKARCRPGTRFVTTDPTWKWPCQFARQAGAEVVEIPIYDPAVGYRLTAGRLAAEVDARTSVIYLVDPNNPLGVCYDRAEIEAFAAIARSVGALLIQDATYRDFAAAPHPVLASLPEGAAMTVSFSKWLGLAGMRIGAVVAAPALIAELAGLSNATLGASVVAQRGAMAGLAVKGEWMARVRALDDANKAAIHARVATTPGLAVPVYPSHGNFLVIETAAAGIRPEALAEVYRRRRIMIRHGAYHTQRFGDRFVKVSTSVPAAWVREFCDLLPAMVEEARALNSPPEMF
ncbi:MAG: pyridoxal phosphate-dependent aminotransferase [Alphaproteobacteria bacterium]|nr:pyridoxal phosphate-dependent aminotransferase [Alphaproteobacteria bacterium]